MQLPGLTSLGIVFVASELSLTLLKRAKSGTAAKDRYSLPLLWLVISASLWLGFEVRARYPAGRLPEFVERFSGGYFGHLEWVSRLYQYLVSVRFDCA